MKEKIINALKWFYKSFIWLFILMLGLDILSKQLILASGAVPGTTIMDWGFVRISYVLNENAAFGIGASDPNVSRTIYLIVASLVTIGLVTYLIWKRKGMKLYIRACLVLIVAGALGNMIDRIFYSQANYCVVDWIDFYWVPGWVWVFNIADSCIVVAAFMLIIYVIVGEVKEYKAKNKTTVKTVNDNKKILSKTEKERLEAEQAQEKESNITTNLMKRDNLFKQKNSYSRILSSQTSKNGQLKLRNNDIINEPIIKSKKYFSLGSVCEVLTKDYKGTTFEFKRKEKSMIFKKKYLEKTQKQKKSQSQQDKNKELSMTMNILQEIEEQKTNYVIFKKSKLNSMKSLKSHKSCSDMLENYRQNKIKNSPKNSNLIIIKNFFKKEKENNKQNIKENNNNENISDLAPLSYDSLWKKNFGKNGCYNKILKVNDFFKNIKNKGYRINNIRLSKLKEIKSDRNKLLKHKLRNLYYSDFEKILLSERLKY